MFRDPNNLSQSMVDEFMMKVIDSYVRRQVARKARSRYGRTKLEMYRESNLVNEKMKMESMVLG